METVLCLMKCPCTCCCALGYLYCVILKTPSDARMLSKEEARPFIEKMQGHWEVVPTEMPSGHNVQENSIAFKEVVITGSVMTFSGGPNRQTQIQQLSIHQTPEGTLYLDDKGTVCTQFSPEIGMIRAKNALGYGMELKRQGLAVTSQPVVGYGLPGASGVHAVHTVHTVHADLPPPPYSSVETEFRKDGPWTVPPTEKF
eukprot:GFUD01128426.1.p1 GENE.GFUD01128426.1~~GFUD01128426.1.p1  ORF type:complete len:209 (-),score=44.05 GFUD01128426.1:28-627(-)